MWDRLLGKRAPLLDFAAEVSEAPQFAVDADSIDPAVFGLVSYADPVAPSPRIDRRSAIQVPAVKRSRDLICGTLGGLPLDLIGPGRTPSVSNLFEQPEKNVPRSVTMTRTVEDMFFEQVAWWRILEFGWHGYPVKVKRLIPRHVTVDDNTEKVYVDGKHVDDRFLIRFDSPNDGLLIAGARAIRTCLQLEAAGLRHAEGAPPLDYFTPAEGADPADDDDVVDILNSWRDARQTRSTGYVPAALKYNVAGWSPEQLQMADARQQAVLEIARLSGIDPEDLGVSTTSRTYANAETRRRDLLDFTLAAYVQAIQDRLSMGDVTPRGYYARLNFNAFLRSDTKTRYESYKVGLEVGAVSKEEVRELEDKPPLAESQTSQEPTVQPAASNVIQARFDAVPELRLDAPGAHAFEVDTEKRTIKGLIVPYGVPARSRGQLWQFSQGTLKYSDVSRVKLWIQHDQNRAVGVATELDDRNDGMYGTFKVARGAAGDEALSYAEDKVLDGFSIGLGQGGKFQRRGDINHAIEAPLMETSLTPAPSFDDARVHSVAAQADTEGNAMQCDKCGKVHAPGVTECNAADVAAFTAAQNGGESAPDFSALTNAITQGFQNLQMPQREHVAAGGQTQVNEPLPYRFDGIPGEHSFSADLRAMASGDNSARQRIDEFMDEAFAVTTTNTATLNPTQNRPELYVPQLEYTRPLWNLVSNGSLSDKTPFTVPKFASAAGLVGPHTEGVEPTPGSFSATNQTITPEPVSGKIEINREVWDQGGSPQADAIIWREMVNGYYEAIEARIATALAAVGTAEINLASAVDEALVDAVTDIFVDLQFVRGGNRFSALALDGLLFKALVNASDSTGRKLLPVLGPSNAQGETNGAFSSVQIGSQRGAAAWALGATNASKSYLFVPTSVWAWASPPKRFTFEYQVKSIDMAVWGYGAEAVLRDSDVKPIDYTTADA